MTFGAMAAWQAWLLVLGAAAAAGGLFLLKVRPPRVVVPSLLLWTRVLDESRERTLWERIRRAVSFAITVALAIALAIALARPARTLRSPAGGGPAVARGRVLIVLDSAWSMLARTRSGETRWERAVAEARRVAAAASGSDVAVATTVDGVIEGPTSDLTSIDAALDRLEPGGGTGSGWPRLSGAEVHFLTDGALARALDPSVIVHSVYESAANAGITAFAVRPGLDGTAAGEAYLEVANFGPSQQVRVTVARGGTAVLERHADLGPGEALREVLSLARGGAQDLRVRIDAPHDALAADNEAFGWIQDARALTVAVVGAQPGWLGPIFSATPGVRVNFARPADYHAGDEDVVIFDRWAPSTSPAKPALYIAPPAAAWLGQDSDRIESRPQWTAMPAHPLLAGVDPLTFSIDRAHVYAPPQLTPLARSAAGTPLIWIGDMTGRPRTVVLAFGPGDSNLASAPAFPVLIGDALDWLARPPAVDVHRTGRASFDAAITRVTGPRGAAVPLLYLSGQRVAVLRAPGLYGEEAGDARASFAVNITDPDVSNLARTTISASHPAVAVSAGMSPRAWWVYLVFLAFGIALLEWWTWLRRITV
ncbi:MAG TPA: BatA domain-containing protein [Vicinamibacterales bacterium]|nr:BatA domain-containing protein [Vicinamibacterales bacterium]